MIRYHINSKEVSKKEFFRSLRGDCQKVACSHVIAGWGGVDTMVFDEKKYRQTQASLRKGHMVVFFDRGRTYALSRS